MDHGGKNVDDEVLVRLESSGALGDDDNGDFGLPPSWSVETVVGAAVGKVKAPATPHEIPLADIGLDIARGTLGRISSRGHKKARKKNASTSCEHPSLTSAVSSKPTPIQLKMWPALLHSFEMKSGGKARAAHNVVGIAPTGTGKTMSYSIPTVSHCVRTLLSREVQRNHSETAVHGLVLVPTRELAIQVAKEFKMAAKVANKYLKKCLKESLCSSRIESIAIYGGVEMDPQIKSISGNEESSASGQTSMIVVATAGRLLDILKQSVSSKSSVTSAFSNLQTIVFDEADRMAVNADMAGQVDEILSILTASRTNAGTDEHVVSCIVSATLPDKAKEVCEKWVPPTRIFFEVEHMKVGDKRCSKHTGKEKSTTDMNAGDDGHSQDDDPPRLPDGVDSKNISSPKIDLAKIPSNIVQTLHVCSKHKKPKKLILTLQRLYQNKNSKNERFAANNRLCIVFFAQIKTVKYVSKLLVKEELRCVEFYGSLNQTEREKRLLDFKAGKRPILLATDVAARGLHISNVNYVVNYDFPGSLDQYVHRCGRAGRKEALSGRASAYPPTVYSFFNRELGAMADSVVDLLNSCKAWVDPNLLALTKKTDSQSRSTNKSQRKRKRSNNNSPKDSYHKASDQDGESDVDQFSFLGQSVLKRASHVSDAEDSDDDAD
ncbi:hypothetical protein ACHAWF_007100 [Thalassiosira exigua]